MSDFTSSQIRIPPDLSGFLSALLALGLPNFIVHTLPLESVAEYSLTQHGKDFPRPDEHFVIADYLIDLPILAVDLGATSPHYGRVFGYAYGDFWEVGDSFPDLLERLKRDKEDAVWGKTSSK